jgi:ADP-ribose pyrophosphatase
MGADTGSPTPRPDEALALWKEAHRSPLPGVRGAGDAYRLLATTLAYPGGWVKVFRNRIRLPNGFETEHEIAMPHDAVSIVPVLEETPGRPEVLLVEQFRSTVEGYIHEIPAGLINPGEEPADCARRELLEETGYEAGRVEPIATIYPTPGFALERMHYFLAEGLRLKGGQTLDPGECIRVKRFPLQGLIESMVLGKKDGAIPTIVDAKTWVGILYAGLRRSLVQREGRAP